jgi:60 kDa SS-A/Ro ribonucleoprotein
MQRLAQHYNVRETPQSRAIPGRDMIQNSGKAYVFNAGEFAKLDRFLMAGTEGGTMYVGEESLTVQNASAVQRLIEKDGVRVVERVAEISVSGRAPKNDYALFVLAMATVFGSDATRREAFKALNKVARIPTHRVIFSEYRKALGGGWGRGMRQAMAMPYENLPLHTLAYHIVKYRNRQGWTHRDVMRMAHPYTGDPFRNQLFRYALGKDADVEMLPEIVQGFELLQEVPKKYSGERAGREASLIIAEHRLTHEMVPSELKSSKWVWEALLADMPLNALIRNLATLTRVGVLTPTGFCPGTKHVLSKLGDSEAVKNARIHPINVLSALNTYQSGHSQRGESSWRPVPQVVDALDALFYTSLGTVEPTNKRILLALDVSSSMTWTSDRWASRYSFRYAPPPRLGAVDKKLGLTPRQTSAAMAMATAAVETDYAIVGFSTDLTPLNISPRRRLDDNLSTIARTPMGATDIAQPFLWLAKNKIDMDAVIVYTDNETNALGQIHPTQALNKYRDAVGHDVKLVVAAMVANEFTVNDPNDPSGLDICGFDSATPQIISSFIAG